MRASFIFFLLLLTLKVSAQQIDCDKLYKSPEVAPHFQNEVRGLTDYIFKKLAPVIGSCITTDDYPVSSLYITLTIGKTGKVTAVELKHFQGSAICKQKIIDELLSMKGWIPGKVKGQNVCSTYYWPISCLKWEYAE